MAERTGERTRILEYPFEYFDVQIQFAKKWTHITGDDLSKVLLEKTALYRRIIGKKAGEALDVNWVLVCQNITAEPHRASAIIYNYYSRLPESRYTVHPHEFNSFEFDYYPERSTVKVHYNPTIRGERSNLGREFLQDRVADLKRMFEHIHQMHPDAARVIGGSWLYNLDAYKRIFPPTYTQNMVQLVPPQLSLTGNSVWGQFVDSQGAGKRDICQKFLLKVEEAITTEDLVNAFPYPTWQPTDDIQNFYTHLGIES